MRTVAVYSTDDAPALHVALADEATELAGSGAAAYLNWDQIISIARQAGCDAIHPGYGFVSENAGFARACAAAGLVFVGPSPESLDLFGDKVRARKAAADAGVPVLPGSQQSTTLEEARAFLTALDAGQQMIIKALAGGGGRGVRIVSRADELESAYARCQSEAAAV